MAITALPDWPKKYIGLKFKEHGRGCAGVDCWGLAVLVYKNEFKIDLPSFSAQYKDTKSTDEISGIIADESARWVRINIGSEKEGDIILIRMRGVPMHVGIAIGNGFMLHAAQGIDTVIENYNRVSWVNRILGVYRHANR